MTQITFTIEKKKEFTYKGGKTGIFYGGGKFKYTDWEATTSLNEGDLLCWTDGSDGYIKFEETEWQGKKFIKLVLMKGSVSCAGKPADPPMEDISIDVNDWLSGGPSDGELPF